MIFKFFVLIWFLIRILYEILYGIIIRNRDLIGFLSFLVWVRL